MIVKMIQNLENKMEAPMNRLEAWIEKMQEMFNRDLGKLKNKQSEMNIIITEINNTLEGTNIRVIEAEEWMSELEVIMVDITEARQIKEYKEMRTGLRDL